MEQLTHIGLDVHKDTIAVAVLRPGTLECDERVIANTPEAIRRLLSRHPDPSMFATCYEAGPTGYDTHRLITSLGFACDVIAPSLIPKRSGVRVKTDRIDARNLARLHRAGELVAIRVPTPAEEAARDLVRAREEVKADRRVARQRIRSFLLRYGKRYPKPNDRWSFRFEVWMRALRFEEPCAQAAFEHLLSAYLMRDAQLGAVDAQIEELATLEPLARDVARLRAFRGIDTLSAVTMRSRRATFGGSRRRVPTWRSRGWCPRSTPAGPPGTRVRSPRPATPTCAACSLRPPGRTGTHRRCAASSRHAWRDSRKRSWPTPGRRSAA